MTNTPPEKGTLVPKKRRKTFKRAGGITKVEKEFVARLVMDQPIPITAQQEKSLAKVLRRSKEAVRSMLEEARENFVASAGDYVRIHKQATEGALNADDFEQALKGSQWALSNLSADGARIVEKESKGMDSGPRIQIGIQVGGVDKPVTMVELPPAEAETP